MVDVVVLERLRALAEIVDELLFFRSKAQQFDTYREDAMLRRAVERDLQVMAEICLDIGRLIAALEGFRYAETNKEVFQVLAEEQILSADLLAIMEGIAGFRNLLVHGYAKIDDHRVFEILHEELEDLDAYADAVRIYLEQTVDSGSPH